MLLPHWIVHNSEHADEFREWAERAGSARDALLIAAQLVEKVNVQLQDALRQLGGPLEDHHR